MGRPVANEQVATRFQELVEQLGEYWGFSYGWQAQAASLLGIHPSDISRVRKGHRRIDWTVARQAARRMQMEPSFFTAPVGTHFTGFAASDLLNASVRPNTPARVKLVIGGCMPWTPGDKPVKAPELAAEVMALVRDQVVSLARRIEDAELVKSAELRAIVSDLIILADMAKGVFEHLPRPTKVEDDDEE